MSHFIMKILLIIIAVSMYTLGEIHSKFLKYIMGIPMGIVYGLFTGNWIGACLIAGSYAIATQFGYGENNWLTKLLSPIGSIIFCGVALGLASMPLIGFWSLLAGLISGGVWYYLEKKDGVINEPWVGILRSLSATILIMGA